MGPIEVNICYDEVIYGERSHAGHINLFNSVHIRLPANTDWCNVVVVLHFIRKLDYN